MDGIELEFEDGAFEAIAHLAIERNTGARGLRSIMENLMMKVMYDIPSQPDIVEITVTEDFVSGIADPIIERKELLISNDTPISGQLK